MRHALGLVAALGFAITVAEAQTPRPAQPAGSSVRHYQLSGEIMDDPSADAFLSETRQGGRVVAAKLDVCYSVTPASARRDRFVVDLMPESGRLIGSTTSQEQKSPISVRLVRKASGDTVDYEGTITRDGAEAEISSNDNSPINEEEFREISVLEGNIVTEPTDFTEVSPEAIFVRVERRALADLVKTLRGENVGVTLESLLQDCRALRSGQQLVRVDIDPLRAPALVAKLRGQPGVAAAGWTVGMYSLDNAVAFDPAAWPGADAREKLMAAIAAPIAAFLGAQADGARFEAASGATTLKFKRPSKSLPGLDLTDTIEIGATHSLDKPSGGKTLVLWIGAVTITTTDESPGARLAIISPAGDNEGGVSADTVESSEIAAAIARELKGKLWDTERATWK